MTARSRERGSHAGRPRGYGLPFPSLGLGTQTPGQPVGGDGVADPVYRDVRAARRTAPDGLAPPAGSTVPQPGAQPAPPRRSAARPAAAGIASSRPQAARCPASRRWRPVAALVVAVVVLGFGFATGFGSEASAEPAVQAFLLDWQQGQYAQAAALTNGTTGQVTAQLAAAYTDLDATDAFFAMNSVTQHGTTAVATFQATVDLAQAGQQWTYTGQFGLTSVRRPVAHRLGAARHQPRPRARATGSRW